MASLTTLFTTTLVALLSSMPNSGAEALSPQLDRLYESIEQQPVTSDVDTGLDYQYNDQEAASLEQPAISDLTLQCRPVYPRWSHISKCFDFTHCPANACPIPGRDCYDSFDDCQCLPGFIKSGHQCVRQRPQEPDVCRNDFHCPSNSFRKPNRKCYDSFDDCECFHGYTRSRDQCIGHFPSHAMMTRSGDDSEQPATSDMYYNSDDEPATSSLQYPHGSECEEVQPKWAHLRECFQFKQCPANACPIPGRNCYDSFDDCQCLPGFIKSGHSCVAVFKPEPFAGTFHFRAFADSFQEVPAVDEPHALGFVSAKLEMRKDAPSTLSWNVHFDGLSSHVEKMHFHGPAPKGQNGDVQLNFPQPIHGFASPWTGVAEVSAEQAADIINGLWYINIHTIDNPTGEIRGQLFLTV